MFRKLFFILLLALFTVPALAQEETTHTASFDGVSFSFDDALATSVNIWGYPGDSVDVMPPQVPHTLFTLYSGWPMPQSTLESTAAIYVYRIAEFADFEEQSNRLAQLQDLIANRSDLTTTENPLPFMPVYPAGQIIRARTQYVETPAVQGISYVTAYMQAQEPFTGASFVYTFQGVSTDGQVYVSLIAPLATDLFPAELSAIDPAEFQAQFETYLAESAVTLNDAAPDAFTPSLDSLTALVESIRFGS
jgi:hypothetical protein